MNKEVINGLLILSIKILTRPLKRHVREPQIVTYVSSPEIYMDVL
jgi:hypothetical protein